MSNHKYLLVETDSTGIQTITINQPKKMNALSGPLMAELDQVFSAGLVNGAVKAFIITGAGGKAFVAGADISEFQNLAVDKAFVKAHDGQQLFRKIEMSPKPVIAVISGYALGGGCELAMACHMRVATDTAVFGQPEVNLGLIPGYGGTQRLTILVGRGKAIEWLMTGQMIKAPEALQWGLVNYVLPMEEAMPKAQKILSKILSKSSLTIAKIVECVDAVYGSNADGYHKEATAFAESFKTEDFVEGVTAFLEKRAPEFKGQ